MLGYFPRICTGPKEEKFLFRFVHWKTLLGETDEKTPPHPHTQSEGKTTFSPHPAGIPHLIHFLVKFKEQM